MNSTVNNDSGPIINLKPLRTNVDGGDSPRGGGGSNISVGARNLHSHHHSRSVSQLPQVEGQQTHGRQAPASGLICGRCNGSIIGRIVSVMGSRWHPACFRCMICNELLEHVSSYGHEGRPYCHLDYRYVLPFVEVEENDAIKCQWVFFCRILFRGVIHARLRLSKNSLLAWMILLLGKEHTSNTPSVLNAEIHFWPLQYLSQIL